LEEDDDDDEKEDAEAALGPSTSEQALSASQLSENQPLLGRTLSRSRSRRRRGSVGPHGDATVTQAILMVRYFPFSSGFRYYNILRSS
jgi:proton-coupled amino acid transporter